MFASVGFDVDDFAYFVDGECDVECFSVVVDFDYDDVGLVVDFHGVHSEFGGAVDEWYDVSAVFDEAEHVW